MPEILVPFIVFASIGIVLWKFFDSRQRVRIAAIEKGNIDENMRYLFSTMSRPSRHGALKWGLAALFVGLALMASIPLQAYEWAQYHQGEIIIGLACTAGGLAFLLYYFIEGKMERRER